MPDPNVLNEAIAVVIDEKIKTARTVVPGKVQAVTRTALGEVDVDFDPGIGTRKGGEEQGDGTVSNAPVAYLGGGGFSFRFPLLPQDEAVGMVVDRNTERWRQTKLVGQAHSFSERHHDLSDTVVFPFRLTPPTPTAPATVTNETTDLVIQGPLGDIVRASPTGPVTIRKGPDGATLATITMDAAGSITFDVNPGQSVNIGDDLAEALVKSVPFKAAMSAMLAAGAGVAPTPGVGNNGSLAFIAAQTAWNSSLASTPIDTTKAKGT